MGLGDAVSVNFSGRACRSEYWYWVLFVTIFGIILDFVYLIAASELQGSGVAIISDIFSIISLAIFLPSLSVTVRRLHDLDCRGWWLLLGIVPLVGVSCSFGIARRVLMVRTASARTAGRIGN